MNDALIERLRQTLGAAAVEELSCVDGHVRCRIGIPATEWIRREEIRAAAIDALAREPGVRTVDVATSVHIRTRDAHDRGAAATHVVAVADAGGRCAAAAAILRDRGIRVGLADLDLGGPAPGAAESRPPVNSDERIVPAMQNGIAYVALARFIPVNRLTRLPRASLRSMVAQFLSLIAWPSVDVVVLRIATAELLEDTAWLRNQTPAAVIVAAAAAGSGDDPVMSAAALADAIMRAVEEGE